MSFLSSRFHFKVLWGGVLKIFEVLENFLEVGSTKVGYSKTVEDYTKIHVKGKNLLKDGK